MEAAIRWSSTSTAQDASFLLADVAGRVFKHCRVRDYRDGKLHWDEISRNTRVPSFRAFDWAPRHQLIAVGSWSGEATLLRPDNTSHALTLPGKLQRQCNAVTFSPEKLLATGLERIRNDSCLQVYDIEQWAAALTVVPSINKHDSQTKVKSHQATPIRKFASSEAVSSIKFFPEQPQLLVAGVKGACVRLYDLRESHGEPVIEYQTPYVHNIAVNPCDQNYFASASPNADAVIHVWDRRSLPRSTAISGLQQSLTNGAEGMVLELKDVFGSSQSTKPVIWSLRYSPAEAGTLGVLGSNHLVRILRTKQDCPPFTPKDSEESQPTLYLDRSSTIGMPAATPSSSDESKTTDAQSIVKPLMAFDFLNVLSPTGQPCVATLRGKQGVTIHELRGTIPTLSRSARSAIAWTGSASRTSMHHNPKLSGIRLVEVEKSGPTASALSLLYQKARKSPFAVRSSSGRDRSDSYLADGWNDASTQPQDAANTQKPLKRHAREHGSFSIEDALLLADRPRRWALEGYAFSTKRNAKIIGDDFEVRSMWDWIEVARNLADEDGLVSLGFDLSYAGVYGVWNEDLGPDANLRKLDARSDRSNRSGRTLSEAIADLVARVEVADIPMVQTSKSLHRRLCLHLLGLNPQTRPSESQQHVDPLLERVKALALAGHSGEGALLALLLGKSHLAATALRSGPRHQQNQALSLLLSFDSSSRGHDLSQQLDAMRQTTQDAFTLAILDHMAGRSLQAIEGLPTPYKLASALLLLPDEALTSTLHELLDTATTEGDLSWLPLSGLTSLSLPIFKAYLSQTADIASPALALAHVNPRYLRSPLADAWRSSYRSQLNAQQLFIHRARFDAQCSRFSTLADGTQLLRPQTAQISMRCSGCAAALRRNQNSANGRGARTGSEQASLGTAESNATSALAAAGAPARGQSNVLGTPRDGTMCPRCGARLPRCVVCDHWVGEVEPRSRAGMARSSEEATRGEDPRTHDSVAANETEQRLATNSKDRPATKDSRGTDAVPVDAKRKHQDLLAGFIETCLRCRHVYHRGHAQTWFDKHVECAAVSCTCRCNALNDHTWPVAAKVA